MPFSNFEDSFCLIKGLYDPIKFREFESSHHREEGTWLPAYDWTKERAFFVDTSVIQKDDKTNQIVFNKNVLIDVDFWYAPIFGFYHDYVDDKHNVVVSGQLMFIPRSFRVRLSVNELESLVAGKKIGLTKDEFFGLVLDKAYLPGIPKVIPLQCGDTTYICKPNYPEPVQVVAGEYGISDKTFMFYIQDYNPTNFLYVTGMFLTDIGSTLAQNAADQLLNSIEFAPIAALFDGVMLNEPITTTYALTKDSMSRSEIENDPCLIRPRFFAHMISGIYTNQSLQIPMYVWYPSTTLVGAVTQIEVMNTILSQNNIILNQIYNQQSTYITNIMLCPANQSTLVSWASVKWLSMFMYPGYPFFNSVKYGDDERELIIYINGENVTKDAVIPYLDGAQKDDIFVGNSLPPIPSFSIFAEMYTVFEGLLMGRTRPFSIYQGDDKFWYAGQSSVQVTTINIDILNPEVKANDTTCKGIDRYTTDISKLNEFTSVNYDSDSLNPLLVFAEGKWSETIEISGAFSDLPVLMSLSSLSPLDLINNEIKEYIKAFFNTQEQSPDLIDICATCYALAQIGDGAFLGVNPLRSLNARSPYVLGFDQRDSDDHYNDSKYGVYDSFATLDADYLQAIIQYTIKIEQNDVSNLLANLFDINPKSYILKDIKGDFINGFDIYLLLQSGGSKTIKLKNETQKLSLNTLGLSVVKSRIYTGFGVFPHLIQLADGSLLFHDDKNLVIFDFDEMDFKLIPISFGENQFILSIVPPLTLYAMYKAIIS